MLGATNHILGNHLQDMHMFREVVENSKDFDKDLLRQYEQQIDETVAQIRNLENIQETSQTSIEGSYLPI